MSEQKTPVSGHGGALPTLSPADLAPDRTGEPRVLDLVLAERLGFERPRDIRELIDRNRDELSGWGGIVEMDSQQAEAILRHSPLNSGEPYRRGRGRPGRAFLLNEDQARITAALSRAPHAPAIRRQLVEAFNAYRALRRDPTPAPGPSTTFPTVPVDPVAQAIAGLVAENGTVWEGTSTHLLRVLNGRVGAAVRGACFWPTDPVNLVVRINCVIPALSRAGICVERLHNGGRVFRIFRVAEGTPSPEVEKIQAAIVEMRAEIVQLRRVMVEDLPEGYRARLDLNDLRGQLATLGILTSGRA